MVTIGSLFDESATKIVLRSIPTSDDAKVVSSWQMWSKRLAANSAAGLIMNNDPNRQSITLDFSTIPTFKSNDKSTSYKVRDIWTHSDVGVLAYSYTVELDSHDSSFLVLSEV